MLLGHLHDLVQGSDVPFHAVEPIHDDQLPCLRGNGAQHALQIADVIVTEPLHIGGAQPRAVHDAGVSILVQHHHVPLLHQGRDAAEVREISRRVDERRFLARELREALLQLDVQLERAVQEARAVVRGPEASKRVLRGRDDLGMLREAQVIVRARHDNAAPVDGHLGAVIFRDREKIGVEACGLGQAVFSEAITLVE